MRALLSTRLFSAAPLDARALELALRAGFPSLELYASPTHADLTDAAELGWLRRLFRSAGVRTPWLHASKAFLEQLSEPAVLAGFADTLTALGVRVVTAELRQWPAPPGLDWDELSLRAAEAGAQLLIGAHRLDDPRLSRSPSAGGIRWRGDLCWDLAPIGAAGGAGRGGGAPTKEELRLMLGRTARGRVVGVRASSWAEGVRKPPGQQEVLLLDEVYRAHNPEVLVYDVDDPLGFAEAEELLEEIRSFHSGEKRPPSDEGGGIFWAALAPG